MPGRKQITWALWILLTLGVFGYLGALMLGPDHNKSVFLVGETTHGHYQIEMACSACHKEPFGGTESLQDACVACHGEELNAIDDSHPKSKFTDPRNASRVEILDARLCVTCHQEHNKEKNTGIGLTLQGDYCFKCHSDIATDRPTHKGAAFQSCASAGCHNYHDNTALYEDFIEKHLDEPDTYKDGAITNRNLSEFLSKTSKLVAASLSAVQVDSPAQVTATHSDIITQWEKSRHALSGINCTACHQAGTGNTEWTDKPAMSVCADCHDLEAAGFVDGKHGMRLKQGLSPMTPGQARLPMKVDAHDKQLDCNSCHQSHEYDTREAAVEQCMTCHNDKHTLAYENSIHYQLWLKEQSGELPPGKGVSCSTCHLPRESTRQHGENRTLVQHNQNLNLRPNEKMLRGVCMNCHGLDFSINALADRDLVERNFSGISSVDIPSTDWVKQRVIDRKSNQSNSPAKQE